MSKAAPRLLLVGRVQGAFGVRGEVRLAAYTDPPMALAGYKPLLKADGSPAPAIASARPVKGGLVARLAGIETKDAADALRGLTLHLARASLPEPEEDEFYLADLVGLAAEAPDGTPLGRIKTVQNFGAGDILEIAPPDGPTWLVAFTRDTAPVIDIPGGRIVIVRPEEVE